MEQNEWKQIYEAYQKPLFLYALSLAKNVQDAEDLLQETFIKAFLAYKSGGSIKYWLVTVLKNEFVSMMRKRKREIITEDECIFQNEASKEEPVCERLIKEEERHQLFMVIQELPLKMREILIESVYFHMDDKTIAKLHGITRENVRKIRSRAKEKLIERYERLKEGM